MASSPWTVGHMKRGLIQYLTETTVHGFRYIVEGQNLLERTVWALFIICGFIFCAVTLFKMNQHWQEHPVETTIGEVGIPIQELPFPAITVCDTQSLTMPRRNRWMFLETFLNSLHLKNLTNELRRMYPGKYKRNKLYNLMISHLKDYHIKGLIYSLLAITFLHSSW